MPTRTVRLLNVMVVLALLTPNKAPLAKGVSVPAPSQVESPAYIAASAQAIVAGGSHTCALTSNGEVKCWGANAYGQLGDGTIVTSTTPVNVSGLTSGITAITAGAFHTCALTNVGGVKCWGRNTFGELGDNTTVDRLQPTDVNGLTSGVSAIVAGWAHTCALTTNGKAVCWGWNGWGQLGDGTFTNRLTPVDVSGLSSGVTAMAAGGGGYGYTCVLIDGGGVKCWGYNFNGQLGDGTTTNRLIPVDVSGLSSGVTAIVAGGYHTCALNSSSEIKCWGYNSSGQVGDGTAMNRTTPVAVIGLSSAVTAITAGLYHTCALTNGGGVMCWGDNYNGSLGDGTTTNRTTPTTVNRSSNGLTAIAAGGHTCAITINGGVKCWGWNGSGQLGNGTTTSSPTPVEVVGLGSGVLSQTQSGEWPTIASLRLAATQVVKKDNYVYAVADKRLAVVDVSTPTKPVHVGESAPLTENINAMAVTGNYVLLVAGHTSLHLFDVSNPQDPVEVGSLVDISWIIGVAAADRYAYVTTVHPNANPFGGQLHIFDISDPAKPQKLSTVGDLNGDFGCMVVHDDIAYVCSSLRRSSQLITYDVSNPSAPALIAKSSVTDGLTNDIAIDGRYAYFSDEGGCMGSLSGTTCVGQGIYVVDATNPGALSRVGFYDVAAGSVAAATDIIFAGSSDGLHILDVSQPSAPFEIGMMPIRVLDVATDVNLAYVATGDELLVLSSKRSDPQPVPNLGRIAFVSDRDGNQEIYTINTDGSGLTNLTNNPAQDWNPIWSPDGRSIAFLSDRTGAEKIHVMNADGGSVRQLTEVGAKHFMGQWSPDGTRIAFWVIPSDERNGILYWADSDGSNVTKVLDLDDLALRSRIGSDFTWSPDGRQFVLSVGYEDSANQWVSDLWVVNADGSNLHALAQTNLPESQPAYSPDGKRLAFVRRSTNQLTGLESHVFIANPDGSQEFNLTQGKVASACCIQWSPDGQWLGVVSTLDSATYIANVNTKEFIKTSKEALTWFWSPDSQYRLADWSWSPDSQYRVAGQQGDIYVTDFDGSHESQLTSGSANDFSPVWQPTPKEPPPPIILLPGIMGSTLRNDPKQTNECKDRPQGRVWLAGKVSDVLLDIDYLLRSLILTDTGQQPANPCDQISPEGVILNSSLLGIAMKKDFYGDFTEAMKGHEVAYFPYDWRLDLATTAKELNEYLLGKFKGRKVILVGHSMGGLLARAYIADPVRAQNVVKVITVGTPYWGAPKLALHMRQGTTGLLLDPLLSKDVIHNIIQNSPGSMQLLPSPRYMEYGQTQTVQPWQGYFWDGTRQLKTYDDVTAFFVENSQNQELIKEAAEFHAVIDDFTKGNKPLNGVEYYILRAAHKQTIAVVREYTASARGRRFTAWEVKGYVAGDDTVPMNSAGLGFFGEFRGAASLCTYGPGQVTNGHGDLLSDDSIIADIQLIVDGENPTHCILAGPGETATLPANMPTSFTRVTLDGSASLAVRDTAGNVTGLTPAGLAQNDIPGATFEADENHAVALLPTEGVYTVTVATTSTVDVQLAVTEFRAPSPEALFIPHEQALFMDVPLAVSGTATLVVDMSAELSGLRLSISDPTGNNESIVAPASVLNEQDLQDFAAPTTTIEAQGKQDAEGNYLGAVEITLTATDAGVGVYKTEYSLDNGLTWLIYEDAFTIDPAQTPELLARSEDKAGNQEYPYISLRLPFKASQDVTKVFANLSLWQTFALALIVAGIGVLAVVMVLLISLRRRWKTAGATPKAEAARCRVCGQPLAAGARFCPKCGTKQ